MPRRSAAFGAPKSWVASGDWPSGQFRSDAPEALAHAVAIATALSVALAGRNKSQVAADARIERSTLYDILQGNTWPDTVTLAKLEAALGETLWPSSPPPALERSTET